MKVGDTIVGLTTSHKETISQLVAKWGGVLKQVAEEFNQNSKLFCTRVIIIILAIIIISIVFENKEITIPLYTSGPNKIVFPFLPFEKMCQGRYR